ncbi:DJ-1 family glyoxalase III [Pseudodesulfovibrio senegalensis]|uniref:DJ-1/PfpI family protein n=1 Tax=Pseudodesulfovibrio senegalensis TaxID=1721087 RepID=A0A6N6N343_9BACT|nr:DJ-1 family glyoxalase III [Pseudodesulfovibrio senegalensis]KAB1442245.1 DJ-1/PfpI family protein [Pseudodesulfovibrio senegalensis]
MSRTVLVPLAQGFEEIETLTIIDVLRRAGADVTTAAVNANGKQVTGAHNVTVLADALMDDCAGPFDLIALPGGMPGAANLAESARLVELLREQDENNRLTGAICAAPAVVLHEKGLLEGKKASAYPSFADRLAPGAHTGQPVTEDGTVITGSGPGTAMAFALALAERLMGEDAAKQLREAMLVD